MNRIFLTTVILLNITLSFSQDYWQALPYPDSTNMRLLNVEGDNYMFFSNQSEPYGLYRAEYNSNNWEFTGTGWTSIVSIAFNDIGTMFLGCFGLILKSEDQGITFDTLLQYPGGASKINIDNNGEIWVGRYNLILHSDDDGITWDTALYTVPYEYFIDIAFGINGEIYAVGQDYSFTGGGFYRSLDNGTTWENTGIQGELPFTIAVNSLGHIFVGCGYIGVFRSVDNGINWENVKSEIDAWSIIIDESDHIYATHFGDNFWQTRGIYYSEDGGDTWDTIDHSGLTNMRPKYLYLDNNNYLYVVCNYSTGHQLFRSYNPLVGIKSEDPRNLVSFTIYPNPGSKYLFVTIDTETHQQYLYNILSMNGDLIESFTLLKDKIDIARLQSGAYFLQLISPGMKIIGTKIFYKY